MLPHIPFWYLRHGQTDWNAQDLSQGRVEVPLNETGILQAKAAAAKLVGRGIVSIVASPLGRAQVTAEIVAGALGLPVNTLPDLLETSFGVQEGKPMGDWFPRWVAGEMTPEGGELFADLRTRAAAAVTGALAYAGPVLVVAHGALFRALRAEMGLPFHERPANAVPTLCNPPPPGETAWVLEGV